VFSPISAAVIHNISIPNSAGYKPFAYLKNLVIEEKEDGDGDFFDYLDEYQYND
jgi:hypothetical protein